MRNFYRYFLDFERMANSLKQLPLPPDADFSTIKQQLRTISLKFFHNFKPHKVVSSLFSRSDILSLRDLAKDESLVICKPDKGRGVVIMDKDAYKQKMNSILSDTTRFRLISSPIIKSVEKIENKVNSFLRKLKELKVLDSELYKQLYVSGSGPGILYGLPKTHKQDRKSVV